MKSFLLLCAVAGAASDASVCQADEHSLLQGLHTMRKVKKTAAGSTDAKAMLKEMREIANSLVEGSDSTMSEDVLTDTLDAVHAQLTQLREATLQQVANAQQQISDASGGFQACITQELTGLQESVEQRAAAVESCQNTLAQLRTAEARQCATAEDCLCDEARVRTTDQEALCTAMTETYEAVFCDQHHMCTSSQQCHSLEAEVYQRLLADVQAEMGFIEQEYIAVEQSMCLNRLTREAMTPPRTRIPQADLDACDNDVDVSALNVNFLGLPQEPAACPVSTHGNPPCGVPAGQVFFRNYPGRDNMDLGSFEDNVAVTQGNRFLHRIDCVSRVIQARVEGGACGGGATVQFRINEATAEYFRDGTVPRPRNQDLEDITVVSGEVVDGTLPEFFAVSGYGGWGIHGPRRGGRMFAASATGYSSGWDIFCGRPVIVSSSPGVVTLTCMPA